MHTQNGHFGSKSRICLAKNGRKCTRRTDIKSHAKKRLTWKSLLHLSLWSPIISAIWGQKWPFLTLQYRVTAEVEAKKCIFCQKCIFYAWVTFFAGLFMQSAAGTRYWATKNQHAKCTFCAFFAGFYKKSQATSGSLEMGVMMECTHGQFKRIPDLAAKLIKKWLKNAKNAINCIFWHFLPFFNHFCS